MLKVSIHKVTRILGNDWVAIQDQNDLGTSLVHKEHFPEEPQVGMEIEMTLDGPLVKDIKVVKNES